jgi:galactoside O-acetyltransferase
MFESKFITENELKFLGFKSLGKNILIDESCIINGIENISIGSNVRIDAFTIINSSTGTLTLGSNIHISNNCSLACSGGVELKDFSGLSSGVKIYSASDDYLGRSMTNPTVPEKYKKVKIGKVVLEKHVIIGSSSVILPNVTISEGASVGALSLVKENLDEWSVYAGSPVKKLGKRLKKLLDLEKLYLQEIQHENIIN